MLRLKILGTPGSKQSARFFAVGGKVRSYQNTSVKQKESTLANEIIKQLPEGFVPFDCPVGVRGVYIFPMTAGMSKKQRMHVENGGIIHKITKPDLIDNTNKQIFDVLEGLVMVNDSRVAHIGQLDKIYGLVPMTIIELYEIESDEINKWWEEIY